MIFCVVEVNKKYYQYLLNWNKNMNFDFISCLHKRDFVDKVSAVDFVFIATYQYLQTALRCNGSQVSAVGGERQTSANFPSHNTNLLINSQKSLKPLITWRTQAHSSLCFVVNSTYTPKSSQMRKNKTFSWRPWLPVVRLFRYKHSRMSLLL